MGNIVIKSEILSFFKKAKFYQTKIFKSIEDNFVIKT